MQTVKRVAVNTVIEYTRLVVSVVLGLITSRVVLNSLGASDYGVYDVIGGVIGLLAFVKTSLAQTSFRFLSVSLGKNDKAETRRTFNNCFWLHAMLAASLAVILEVVGIFLFDGFLNIDPSRVKAAETIYHCMVISLVFGICDSPFAGLVRAHEKFIFSASVGMLDAVLKFAIAILISHATVDRLQLYGMLMALIAVVNTACFVTFILLKYRDEFHIGRISLHGIKEVSGFAGWTVLDVLGTVATRQGYSVLLNKYFGTLINAVFSLARQVEGHVYTVSASVMDTTKPQIMKSAGKGDYDRMFRISMTAGKFGFSMMSLIAIPLIVMMPDVLDLWLVNVPEGTVLFTRLLLFATMAEQLTRGIYYASQANGKIKWFSITVSAIRFMALPISWLCFHLDAPAYVAIIVFLCCEVLGSASRVFIISKITVFKVASFIKSVILMILPPCVISFAVCILGYKLMGHSILALLADLVLTAVVYAALMYTIGLTKEEKVSVDSLVKPYLKKFAKK